MAIGNDIGFAFDSEFPSEALFLKNFGGFLLEATEDLDGGWLMGRTIDAPEIRIAGETVTLDTLKEAFEGRLESVFPTHADASDAHLQTPSWTERNTAAPAVKSAKPLAVIPVFPGTNCEYDTAKAVENAGGAAEIVIVRNYSTDALARSAEQLADAVSRAQMVILPGGFSGGDEPDGSGKFITAFFRSPAIKEEVRGLLQQRDGLMCGICNGFQALVKLGLVPYGDIVETTAESPTLTYNVIGRHQSMLVRTRVASAKSPWFSRMAPEEVYTVAVSHGEGRFVCPEETALALAKNGQVATQYTDAAGQPSMDIDVNPNGSLWAIEGIFSPDGRVFGKMGHSERQGPLVGKNIPGSKHQPLFESGAKYFR